MDMKINNNQNKYSYSPNFKARPIAKIKSAGDEVTLYLMDKVRDKALLEKISKTFTEDSLEKRFPNDLMSVSEKYMKNALLLNDERKLKRVLSFSKGVPTGVVTYDMSAPKERIYINFLAAWVPEQIAKVKNNGRMLLRQVFQDAVDSNNSNIEVVPFFRAMPFYEKNGFVTPDYDYFYARKPKEAIENLDKFFTFEKIENAPHIDLDI